MSSLQINVMVDADDVAIQQLANAADPEDIETVKHGLIEYNSQHAGDDDYTPLHIFLRDADNQVVGGLLGVTYWGWLNIAIVWIDDAYRGRGYGKTLIELAEQEAVRRGCKHAHLDTMSFQALAFYEKLGYTVFGALEDIPEGHQRYFFQKRLGGSRR
jgi:GNAT superfamily N-acetyltransferase